jgi:hypothetical protein
MKPEKSAQALPPERLILPYEQWLTITEPDYFAQTDSSSEAHWRAVQASSALNAYLNTVSLIRLEPDQLIKLNGGRRKQLWTSGALEPPLFIAADVYTLTPDEFATLSKRLYTEQLENLPPHEVVIAAYKELDLDFSSERLNKGFITEALNIALRGKPRAQQDKRSIREKQDINITKAIGALQEELLALDGLNLKPDIFVTGVLAAALLMVALDKDNIGFFRRLNNLDGQVSDEGLLDPLEALLSVLDSYKGKRITQVRLQLELCGKTVKAVLLWNQGRDSTKYWTKNTLRLIDYLPYIREMKRKKGIHEANDL